MTGLRNFVGIEGTDFFEQDRGLQRLLDALLPADARSPVAASLHECAERVAGDWNALAIAGSRTEQLPRIVADDRVGNPIERVDFGPYTKQLRREVAELGVLTKARNELHRFSMVYLLAHNGEASLTCPIACTDGLLRVLDAKASPTVRDQYRERAASADTPFAGAQFVTEIAGGSDIGAIEATAEPIGEGTWAITGEKWFCSNPDEFFVIGARPKGATGGTRGVGLFLVPRVLPDGSPNSLRIKRLKDKLGTRSLPTAEIDFIGAKGFPLGDPREGFQNLMHYVINTSRLHNAANALGFMHRAYLEARNYARQREAFGAAIVNYPLVQETLVALLATLWRERVIFFRLLAVCDAHGTVPGDREQRLWQRFLTNLAKYRTAVGLTAYIRDAILVFGGNGIVEDFTILPRLLRDAMIIETWEGTHNTLTLQIARDLARFDFAARWRREVGEILDRWPSDFLAATRQQTERTFGQLEQLLRGRASDPSWATAHARRLVDGLAGVLGVVWMVDLALRDTSDATAAALAAVAADQLWRTDRERLENSPTLQLGSDAVRLIDETPLAAPAWLRAA